MKNKTFNDHNTPYVQNIDSKSFSLNFNQKYTITSIKSTAIK